MNRTASAALVACCALACGGDSGDDSTAATGNFFFDSAADTAPVIQPSAVQGLTKPAGPRLAATWDFGNVNYELFNLLREYVNERDEGSIGLDNIYKVLYQAGSFYTGAAATCSTITEREITSPFDFGMADTYDCAVNDTSDRHGYAVRVADGVNHAILAWQVLDYDGHGSDEKGVLQGTYNPTTGDLVLNLVTYVNYAETNDFSLRTELTGNDQTHQFTLRTMKYTNDGYSISVVGQGISQGAGNHFLFQVTDSNGISGSYYCFNAEADEETLKNNDDAGSATVAEECADYEATVAALTPFVAADVPTADSAFNAGNPNEGTIYLDGID